MHPILEEISEKVFDKAGEQVPIQSHRFCLFLRTLKNEKGEFYKQIIENMFKNKTKKKRPIISECVYLLFRDLEEAKKCENCKTNYVRFINLIKGYAPFCSRLCNTTSEMTVGKIKNTVFERFGSYNMYDSLKYRRRVMKTMRKRYGVKWYYEVKKPPLANEKGLLKYNFDYPIVEEVSKIIDKKVKRHVEIGSVGFFAMMNWIFDEYDNCYSYIMKYLVRDIVYEDLKKQMYSDFFYLGKDIKPLDINKIDLGEAAYLLFHKIKNKPFCSVCERNRVNFGSFSRGYVTYCSSYCLLADEFIQNKIRISKLKKQPETNFKKMILQQGQKLDDLLNAKN